MIVDISNDEPGAIETSRATTHEDPRYIVDGIVHYCVANIPGAVAHSASVAYAAQMLPLILHLLNDGEEETCIRDGYYRRALTIYRGLLTHEETSAIQGKPWVRPEEALGISGFRLDPAPLASDTHSTHFIPGQKTAEPKLNTVHKDDTEIYTEQNVQAESTKRVAAQNNAAAPARIRAASGF